MARLKGAFSGAALADEPDRRASKRLELPIQVQLKIGSGQFLPRRLRDINQRALCAETDVGEEGDAAAVRFAGNPEVCGPFTLVGRVVRTTEQPPVSVIDIDRQATTPEAQQQYRNLVLHYIQHKPLLEELAKGYFEGRCQTCGWIGRVGNKSPSCSRCGKLVVPIDTH